MGMSAITFFDGQKGADKFVTQVKDVSGLDISIGSHSCTAALEMSAILIDLQPGDEVIMPSYTYVSTANAFALRGANVPRLFFNSQNELVPS